MARDTAAQQQQPSTNTLFPGRPNYVGPNKGIFGLLHHNILVERSFDVMNRVHWVERYKLDCEVPIRLRDMIYLGDCPAAYELLNAFGATEKMKKRAKVLAYIKQHNPKCAWKEYSGGYGELRFRRGLWQRLVDFFAFS